MASIVGLPDRALLSCSGATQFDQALPVLDSRMNHYYWDILTPRTWPRGYKTTFMLNSAEHEIFSANKYENANNSSSSAMFSKKECAIVSNLIFILKDNSHARAWKKFCNLGACS